MSLKEILDRIKNAFNKNTVLEAVRNNGYALKDASERLRDDKDVALAAVKNCYWALQFASERLQDDKDFVMEVVKQNGIALEYASKRFKEDKEFLYAIKNELLKLDGFDEVKENLSRYEHEDSLLQRMQERNAINPDKQQVVNISRKKI